MNECMTQWFKYYVFPFLSEITICMLKKLQWQAEPVIN